MKGRSLFVVVIIVLLLLFAFNFENKQTLASDQKLAHGAGTLPHLTSALTLSLGFQILTPYLYSLQYDIGLGNRVQLGLSTSIWPSTLLVDIHSMFNVLKTAKDSDFLSLYLNPCIGGSSIGRIYAYYISHIDYRYLGCSSGVAYEHRFGSKRHFGLYTKAGVLVLKEYKPGKFRESNADFGFEGMVGFQALIGDRFSIAVEPELFIGPYDLYWAGLGGKLAFTLSSQCRSEIKTGNRTYFDFIPMK